MATQIIYIAGDVHLRWDILNAYIDQHMRQSIAFKKLLVTLEENPCNVEFIILQCGDFGIWKPQDIGTLPIENQIDFIKDGHVKIYFVDGNHENHDVLDALEKENPNTPFPMVCPYVYFTSFGSILKLIDGTKILFVGGAESADKAWRIEGKEWWRQEGIDENDMAKLPRVRSNEDKVCANKNSDTVLGSDTLFSDTSSIDTISTDTLSKNNMPAGMPSIDWVVSHAAPLSFDLGRYVEYSRPEKLKEPSRYKLEEILQLYKPNHWFFGHYHYSTTGNHLWENQSCLWKCMNYSDANNLESWITQEKIVQQGNAF